LAALQRKDAADLPKPAVTCNEKQSPASGENNTSRNAVAIKK